MLTLLQNKRVRFFFVSVLLAVILALLSFQESFLSVFILPAASLLFLPLALGKMGGVEAITFPILPLLFSMGASLDQYLFPNFHPAAKVVGWFAFFFGTYTLLLALNVFKVSRIRKESIPLEKAAQPVVFIFAFGSAFLLMTALYKLDLGVILGSGLLFGLIFVLAADAFWFLTTRDLLERRFFAVAALLALAAVQVSLAFSFFPWKAHLRGISEATFFYSALGVSRAIFGKHLKYAIVLEYILVSLAVLILAAVIR